ncbi:MAG: LruC domain-containing protein, partial [Muribaculaceae bacterium]|nr:LruC domain-containing protein [Muribaculaceae bacterium]
MKKTHGILPFLLLAGCAAILGGCSDDRPEIPSDELYVREFIKNYGVPDAGQTWSMARGVETSVNVQGVSNGTLEVYTDNPESPTARMAARLPIVGGKVNAKVPLLAGSDKVYFRVLDADNTIRGDYASALSAEKKIETQLKVNELPADAYLPTKESIEQKVLAMGDTARAMYQEMFAGASDKNYHDLELYLSSHEIWDVKTACSYQQVPNLYMLNNVYFEMGAPLSYRKTLMPIFQEYVNPETNELEDGVFRERRNNLERYYHNHEHDLALDPNVTFSVREEGPVTMQCTWRGTDSHDSFGYFYYKVGQEPSSEEVWNNLPKYIFLDGETVSGLSNLTQTRSATNEYPDSETGWVDMSGMNCPALEYNYPTNGDNDIWLRGRKYYLVYYGDNYDEEPSYTFPTGVRIGYFVLKADANGANGRIYFSDCRTQYELCRNVYYGIGEGQEGPLVRPFAAKFRMNNRNYIGFGDESGDCDLNDIVFIAENVYPDPVDITPPEIKEEHPEAQAWTLACEDLGNTDDIDFNDVVLDITYVTGETTLSITPRAAGGVLVTDIYFRQGDNSDHTFLGEIHNMLSNNYSATPTEQQPMLNTKRENHEVNPRSVKSVIVSVPADFEFTDPENGFMARIKITTRGYDEKLSDAKEVKAYTDVTELTVPQMLLLPGGWRWPEERRDIKVAYPDFTKWVKDVNATDWVNTGLNGYTVSH